MPRPSTLPGQWALLAGAIEAEWLAAHPGQRSPGAVLLTAQALSSNPRTIGKWAREYEPRGAARVAIEALFRRYGVAVPWGVK